VNNGNMPAYNVQIPVEDRWAIVAYIRELERTRDPNVGDEPAPGVVVATVGAERGAGLYKSKGCNACHSIDGTKVVGPSFKGLWGKTEETDKGPVTVDEAYVRESILTPTAKITAGFPPAMPPQALSDDDIKSIVLYLQTLK
jgi:cytochrome c551/c552